MDLYTLENTSTYAIQAIYDSFWGMIPQKYKLPEDDKMLNNMEPFYDPELTFENRLHYKLTKIDYPKRATPWFVITWNPENGIIKSGLTQRRFTTDVFQTKQGLKRGRITRTEMSLNFAIASNTMEGIFELQENYLLRQREKLYCQTRPHSILGSFTVCMDLLDSNQSKLSRDHGTICYLFLSCRVDYPVVGMLEDIPGVIEEIHNDVNRDEDWVGERYLDSQNISKDIITDM